MSKTIVFVGNPNVGKTAWINALSHHQFQVGNWPGVTVEKKEATVVWNENTYHLLDLPGCYDLEGKNEERITATYLKNEQVDVIVNVVDVMNLSRNLLLTLALRELQIPMLLIFNFMDEAKKYGVSIDLKRIGARLQIPVIAYSAYDKTGYAHVREMIIKQCEQEVCYYPLYAKEDVETYVDLCNLIEAATKHQEVKDTMLYRLCTRILYRDEVAIKQVESWGVSKQTIVEIYQRCDPMQLMEHRYQVVQSLMRYVSKQEKNRYGISQKIDQIVLHKYLGIPCFFFLFTSLLLLAFRISDPWTNFFDTIIIYVSTYVQYALQNYPVWLQDMMVQGVLQGVGGVLSFLPLMACLYALLALLEECGYMARIAVLLERFMRIFHLSGKSFVAFMMGFGCNVAAIYATRTLDDEQQKKRVALAVPFMSCGARLPIYALFGAAFFGTQTGLMICTIYGIGILVAFILSLLSVKMKPSKPSSAFLMELPPYRKPNLSVVFYKTKKEMKSYVQKAYKVVLVTMLILWGLGYTSSSNQTSMLEKGAKQVQFLFEPLGFGTRWECIAALPTGIIAKETIVAYFTSLQTQMNTPTSIDVYEDVKAILILGKDTIIQTLFPFHRQAETEDTTSLSYLWTGKEAKLKAFSYLVYILLSIPCMMTLQALRKEFGYRLMLLSMLIMMIVPYITSFCIYQIGYFLMR